MPVSVQGRAQCHERRPRAFRLPRSAKTRGAYGMEGGFSSARFIRRPPLTLTLRPLPREDNEAYQWVEPRP